MYGDDTQRTRHYAEPAPREHAVHVEGVHNFRDCGGYITDDGREVVRAGLLFRAEAPDRATERGRQTLRYALRVRYIVDLRGHDEVARAPYHIDGIARVSFPLPMVDYFRRHIDGGEVDATQAAALMRGLARHLILEHATQLRGVFDFLLNVARGQAVLFHCSAGKDRTGIVCALLLHILHVPFDTIVADYVATNEFMTQERRTDVTMGHTRITAEALAEMTAARGYFVTSAFDAARAQFGSIDAYLTNLLGVNEVRRRQLRSYYLTPHYNNLRALA